MFAYQACLPKKYVNEYCESSMECRNTEGLVCYTSRHQCDCADLANYIWSSDLNKCVSNKPEQMYGGNCTGDYDCKVSLGLQCDLSVGQCACADPTNK